MHLQVIYDARPPGGMDGRLPGESPATVVALDTDGAVYCDGEIKDCDRPHGFTTT